jgi:phosphate starvation-inducible PhoH-like protein
VHFAQLTSHDVVRHRLVGDIVDAYGRWDALHADPAETGRGRPRDHRERDQTRSGRHPRSAEGRR